MSRCLSLSLTNFRNLRGNELKFSEQFCCFVGENGSGKTSLLEAIYFLGHARSFRSSQMQRIIQYQQSSFTLNAKIQDDFGLVHNLGFERSFTGEAITKLSGKALASSSELACLLPTLLIYPNSYRLLDHGPKARRQFIDWGLFHVEPSFYSLWKQLNRILKQRNSLLRQGQGYQYLEPWDCEFVKIANEINRLRDAYLLRLLPIVVDLLARFVKIDSISFNYYRGWAKDRDLSSTLEQAYQKDVDRGYSFYGPQRADLEIKAADFPAHEVLSRGQQKLLVIAMKLAQGILLREWVDKTCLFLLDDITAELDDKRQKFVISSLKQLKAQVFMTLLDEIVLDSLRDDMAIQMFHVEHGDVSLCENASELLECC